MYSSRVRDPADLTDHRSSASVESGRRVVRGEGVAIVFAHGMGLDCEMWTPQLDALSKSYRTIAYDLRGRTLRGRTPYSLYDLASDFTALLDELNIDRCVLVGLSMGGYLAVRVAVTVPQRLHGMVLIGAAAVPFPQEQADASRAEYEQLRGLTHIGLSHGQVASQSHFSPLTQCRRPELVRFWADRIATRSGEETFHELMSIIYQNDVRSPFAQMNLPCLLIHGDQDHAVPLEHALETHRLARDSRLMVLPYASHAPNLENPVAVNDAIASFCAEILRPVT